MRGLPSITIALIATALLSGCDVDVPPLATGDIAVYREGAIVETRRLNSENLTRLAAWLQENRNGWDFYIATPAADVSVTLTASDGGQVGLYILGRSVIIVLRNSGAYSQSFQSDQLAALYSALGVRR